MDDRLSKSSSSKESDPFQAASDVRTLDGGGAQGSTDGGGLSSGVAVATLDAGLARERARQALFGEAEVEHKINRYTVIDQLGAGAMGIVYAAYDPDLDRRVAVKLVRSSRRDRGPETRDRMIAEARAMAKVSHPNVVSVFEVGVTDGDPPSVFVAMEFVEGRTLKQWQIDDKPEWRKIVAVYAAAGRGLAAVHRAGLVHRDFKPENAMIDSEGRVRVMDFGLARDTDDSSPALASTGDIVARTEELTRTGELVGTPAYMAPERFAGLSAHPGSDQWAFCIALYESLWGQRPYVANSVGRLATIVSSVTKPPEAPSSPVPRRIRAAILRGLHPDPEKRWPSMTALVAAISPRRRNVWAMTWLGLGGLALASGWILSMPSETACEVDAQALGGAWGPERAAALKQAFEHATPWGTRAADDVIASLDMWAETWLAQHREACEATRVLLTQSDAMLDRRMRCLERRRREVTALVDVLVRTDATGVELAEDAVGDLVPPDRCGDVAFLDAATEPPSDPGVARAVEELRGALAEIDAAGRLGQPAIALERARGLDSRVEATEYGPLQAELALAKGRLLFETAEPEASRVELEKAYFGARKARDPITAIDAALHVASLDITFGTEFERGEHWVRLAEVEVESHGLTEQAYGVADLAITLHSRTGDFDLAITESEALLERIRRECGEDCDVLAETHLMAAHVYSLVSRYEEAIAHARRGLELDEARYGEDHPQVAAALMRLGDVLEGSRHYEEAERALARAVTIRERVYGPDHLKTAISRVELGVARVGLERGEEGVKDLERALEGVRAAGEKQTTAATLNQLGWAYGEVGRHEEARKTLTEAADIMRALHPDGHPFLAITLSNIAGEATEVGDHEGALRGYEEALAMRRKVVTGRDPQTATFLVNLGRTLAKLERFDEAVVRLREALDVLRDEPLGFDEVGARRTLSELLRERDPEAAEAVLIEGRARCGAAPEAERKAASCDRLD